MPAKPLARATKRSTGAIKGTKRSRVPGTPRMPARRLGGFLTKVPRLNTATAFRQEHFQQVRDVRGQFAGGWGFAWLGLGAANDALLARNNQLHEGMTKAVDQLAQEIQQYMQENAPWTDETGNARAGLQTAVTWDDADHFTIFAGHGKDIYYGVWLEVRWGGRYAIILPTLEVYAPQIAGRVRAQVG